MHSLCLEEQGGRGQGVRVEDTNSEVEEEPEIPVCLSLLITDLFTSLTKLSLPVEVISHLSTLSQCAFAIYFVR